MNLRKRRKQVPWPLSAMGDIAFLLLIFYMATTLVTDQKPRDIAIPIVEAESQQSPFPLVIYLDQELAARSQAYFWGQNIALDKLAGTVTDQATKSPGAITLYLNIERNLPYRYLNAVIEQLKEAGIRSLVVTTRPEE